MDNEFSAIPALRGYFYQCKYALYRALQLHAERGTDFGIGIEKVDDFHIDMGTSTSASQVKHSDSDTILTDKSVNLWKTIKIWSHIESTVGASVPYQYFLVSTAHAAPDSGVWNLRRSPRNIEKARKLLIEAARTSDNSGAKVSQDAFVKLKKAAQLALLNKITVVDGEPNTDELNNSIGALLLLREPKRSHAVGKLVAWWLGHCDAHFTRDAPLMTITDVILELQNIIVSLHDEALPPYSAPSQSALDGLRGMKFLAQLDIIEAAEHSRVPAAHAFYVASTARNNWVEEELVTASELADYDQRLKREWEAHFEYMKDELEHPSDAACQKRGGRDLYKWVALHADLPLRTRVLDRIYTTGSYQMLANEVALGWHPAYKKLMR